MPTICKCPYCGKETYRELAECPHCGASFVSETAPNIISANPAFQKNAEDTSFEQTEERERGSSAQRFVKGLIGFVIAFGSVLLIEFLVVYGASELFNARLVPRGLGWVVIPVIAGIAGWKLFRDFPFAGAFGTALESMSTMNRVNRFLIATYASWTVIVCAYVYFVEPFGYSIRGSEWKEFFQALLVPPVIFTMVVFLFRWVFRK